MLGTILNNTKKKTEATMSDSERRIIAKAMANAGYEKVTPEMVQKIANKYGYDVYVAVVGDAMVVYTPQWDYHHDGGFNFVCF